MPDELPEGHIQMGGKWQHMALPGEEAIAPVRRTRQQPVATEESASEAQVDEQSDEDDET